MAKEYRAWFRNTETDLKLILPVTPFFKQNKKKTTTTVNLLGCGEIETGFLDSLDTYECDECFFPFYDESYRVDYEHYEPFYYKAQLEEWFENGTILDFAYYYELEEGQYKYLYNTQVKVTSVSFYNKGGSKNIYYKLTLQEYKDIVFETGQAAVQISSGGVKIGQYAKANTDTIKKVLKEQKNMITVKEGQTIKDIAREYAGTAEAYQDIMKMNALKNPFIKAGDVLKIK